MPFTFSGNALQQPLADFGNDAANMILQTGATIQQGLQSMMTNRQVAALGQELGTLNPESPEWAQQAIKLGSRYPLAMKSPAGQFMLGTQAKAHSEWRQMQQATQQQNAMLQRGMQLENLRTQNDIKLEGIRHQNRMAIQDRDMVDLVPSEAPAVTPSSRLQGMSGMGMIGRGLEMASAAPQAEAGGGSLYGQNDVLPNMGGTPADRVKRSLVDAGFKKIPGKELRSTIAGEIRADRAREMQEDRQKEAEKVRQEAEASRVAREERAEERLNKKFTAGGIKAQLDNVGRDIDRQSRLLANVIKEQAKAGDRNLTKAEHALRTEIQGEIQALGEERTLLEKQFKGMGGDAEVIKAPGKTRIIERGGKKFEVDDETKQVLREVK